MNAGNCDAVIVCNEGDDHAPLMEVKRCIGRARRTVRRWQAVAKQRRELGLLAEDPDFLDDIGVSQGDAMMEANKPFWKA